MACGARASAPAARSRACCRRVRPTRARRSSSSTATPARATTGSGSSARVGATRRARGRASTCRTSARRSRRTASSTTCRLRGLPRRGARRARGRARRTSSSTTSAARSGSSGRRCTPTRVGERDADRHRHPARLQMAQAGADLAHAGARRALPGDRDPPRASASLLNRNEPRGLPREFVEAMYDHYDRRTRRAVLALYRGDRRPGRGRRPSSPRCMAPKRHPGAGDLGRARRLPAVVATRRASARRSPRPTCTCCRPAATGRSPTRRRRSSGCWSSSSTGCR